MTDRPAAELLTWERFEEVAQRLAQAERTLVEMGKLADRWHDRQVEACDYPATDYSRVRASRLHTCEKELRAALGASNRP